MQRLIDAMADDRAPHDRLDGAAKDQMTLGPNMYGDEFLPQPSILPQCDLLITHGGNNTTCEGFHFGLPDDRAAAVLGSVRQRSAAARDGVRRAAAHLRLGADDELTGAVDRLLGRRGPAARMARIAEPIRADPGRVKGRT